MIKIYDKLILVIAVLLLAGGVFVYIQKSGTKASLAAPADVQLADNAYVAEPVPSSSAKDASWPEAPEQSTGWRYDVFTPPKIFIDENGQFSEEGWKPAEPLPPFGIYLASIERKLYRLQLEGYIEEDRSDPSKTLLLLSNEETNKQVRARPGDERPEAEFALMDFKIERIRDEFNNIEVVAKAVILDQRLEEEITLVHGQKRYDDGVSITIRSKEDPNFSVVLHDAPSKFEGPIGQYNLLSFDSKNSTITVERQVAEGEEPDMRTLSSDN